MTLPEWGTPEFDQAEERVHRRLTDTVMNIGGKRRLPPMVLAIVYDEPTGEIFDAYLDVQNLQEGERPSFALLTRRAISMIRSGANVVQVIDDLMKIRPNIPIICDNVVTEELSKYSLTWVQKDHYRLVGRPNGILEVYTPYKVKSVPQSDLPKERTTIQFYRE